MTIIKSFGYGNGSPYKSNTFNQNNALIFNGNGPLTVESIKNVGTSVVLGNITFIQEGVIVQVIGGASITLPSSMVAPYYLTANIPDTKPIDNIIWGFAKSPQDMSSTTVLVAAWDGQEWTAMPTGDIKSIMSYRRSSAIAWQMLGFNQGFQFLPNFTSGIYTVGPGSLTDTWGELIPKYTNHIATAIPADPDFKRIDAMIYRRGTDHLRRIGVFALHPGPGYLDDDYHNIKELPVTTTAGTSNYRIINSSDNKISILSSPL